jgi:iron complex transport system permease protein
MNRTSILFLLLIFISICLFIADLVTGSVPIGVDEVIKVFFGKSDSAINSEILFNFRLPKALTAIIAGASLSVAGLMMQTLFRNPLADPYILGVSSGASLGVAVVMMLSTLVPLLDISSGWTSITAAVIGASTVLLFVVSISFKVRHAVSLLIVGIMFGTISSSLVSIIQNFSNPETVKLFLIWTFGSLSSVTWAYLKLLFPIVFASMGLAFFLHKRMDVMQLGENYARGLGISIIQTRFLVVLATGLLAGSVTAFAGPIAFVGVAIPHIARGVFRSSYHRVLIPACVLCGAALLLLCDIVSQLPTYILPINVISALFGAPIIIWIVLKRN